MEYSQEIPSISSAKEIFDQLPEFTEKIPKSSPISKWQATHESWKLFDQLREKGCFCDVTLKSQEGVCFPAHRLIICTCSEYFRSLFSGRWQTNSKEVELQEIKSRTLQKIITFAYSREVELSSSLQAKELLLAANHLCVEGLSDFCIEYLEKRLSPSNCISMWSFSKEYCCIKLEAAVEDYLMKNFMKIALSSRQLGKKLLDLDSKELLPLITKNNLILENEGVLFLLVMRWYNKHKQIDGLLMLLHGIRWLIVPISYLTKVVIKHRDVVKNPQIKAFFDIIVEAHNDRSTLDNGKEIDEKLKIDTTLYPICTNTLRSNFCKARDTHNLIFVVGGWCGKSPTNSVEIHDPSKKVWLHATPTYPKLLERRRAYHAVAEVGGCIYVIGGFDGFTIYNSCDRYNLKSGTWTSMCGMAKRRCYVAVTKSEGKIFAIGGSDEMPSDNRLKSVEVFSPDLNTWSSLPDMKEQRSDAGACFMRNSIYVAGGFTGKECVSSVEFYSFDTLQWSVITPMRIPRSGVSVVSYLDGLVVLGGFDGHTRLRTVEYYDFEQQSWHKMPRMHTKRSNFASCVIGKKLYVMGGFNDPSTCSNTECFINTFNQADSFSQECDICYSKNKASSSSNDKVSNKLSTKQKSSSTDQGDGDFSQSLQECFSDKIKDENFDGYPLCDCQLNQAMTVATQGFSKDISGLNLSSHCGKWEVQSNMVIERSAHSCCVVNDFPSQFLQNLHSSKTT